MTNPPLYDLAAVITWLNEQRLSQPEELHRRVTTLEEHMATSAEQIATINANLANIQSDVQRLNQIAVDLQTEIANQDPALAERLQPLVDLSAQIASATPEPVDGGDTPADPTQPGDEVPPQA